MIQPYYSDYIRDIVYPAHAKQVPAPIPKDVDPLGLESIEHIRDAIRRSNAAGTTIRVLILCNPHNPLANAYPIDTVKAYAKTAQEFNLHLLVDEVYANQVFSSSFVPDPTPFVSVLSLDVRAECGCDPSRIHVLAGPTKDLGASGLKVGAFVSQHNPDLVQVVRGAIASIPISSASDALLTAVLRDDAFRIWFLEENRRRLSKAFENVAAWCLFHDIPFVPASAGVYVLADFATLMDKLVPTDMLVQDKLDAAVASMFQNGVFIRPTTTYGDPIPTRFRMTFTLPEDTMRLALHRLENAFNLTHWQDEKVI
ncbi:hypothetical protein PLICRDRAFT_374221 [Plicaturopsis crispa FD-325 SS-3]|uniref:Aminotransferase class I/classII large domain-containing protein n=1 Tax=Plicaturopsis crispa FD-325 SS-3 TaxID=944288 RepID=A0A0C9T7R7_PLICR|nr:hypothetical protein PLICRDRAFT_374221 [Plicaturopsis crispa FD-325 SS-3]